MDNVVLAVDNVVGSAEATVDAPINNPAASAAAAALRVLRLLGRVTHASVEYGRLSHHTLRERVPFGQGACGDCHLGRRSSLCLAFLSRYLAFLSSLRALAQSAVDVSTSSSSVWSSPSPYA